MPIDTHAAFRKLENGGFETQQAEALVEVINGVAGEQATKDDIRELREEVKQQREDFSAALGKQGEDFSAALEKQREHFNAALKEQGEHFNAALKEQGEHFNAALKEQGEHFNAALKEQREDFNAAFKEQREDFHSRFATKEDFAKLETRIEAASNRMLFALMAVATLLFAALKLWP